MSGEKRVIKKYPNRRLYDTATSCYITLSDVKQLVLDNIDIQVLDAKAGDDITRSVLLQIIMEEESGEGMPMFSYDVLTRIIRFYGHTMQGLMGNYLEKNLLLFTEMQRRLQDQAQSAISSDNPMLSNTNLWGDFMKFQGPALQNMMGNYLESSTNLFVEMQQQLQDRAKHLFSGFGMPGYGKAGTEPTPDEPQPSDPPPTGTTQQAAPEVPPRRRSTKR
ncbi:polyhydroxyalkanoate synthesis repressor PhaR [Chitiniphilus purpureus]|uniref:Polyhydroxyalkanoate synthesis repressor PhaR n=1 Tax=Chitiniphilus purpureus TaxID=2981137 RepID=A0ABY6DJC1_9NEIS|nr:polyhydroxyalkanoate synthesis repressor PhaR [Chitiniphilus sp. CD1]UXY14452.1 polyhydroxyalkanoate synthesis repressor PhaR [Chitiniphilus sp. CD1]